MVPPNVAVFVLRSVMPSPKWISVFNQIRYKKLTVRKKKTLSLDGFIW